MMRSIVPTGEEAAGLILPVIGIFPFAILEKIILYERIDPSMKLTFAVNDMADPKRRYSVTA